MVKPPKTIPGDDATANKKMDWVKKIVSIKEKLSQHGFPETAARITEAQMIFGTPGEMYLQVMTELLDIKKRSGREYFLIEEEIKALLDYGKSIGYFNPPE